MGSQCRELRCRNGRDINNVATAALRVLQAGFQPSGYALCCSCALCAVLGMFVSMSYGSDPDLQHILGVSGHGSVLERNSHHAGVELSCLPGML